MEDKKWYRVGNVLNPLNGYDVRLCDPWAQDYNGVMWQGVRVIRRTDVVVGDRPFQMEVAGILVRHEDLTESPIQDDVVEMSRTSPYGKFLHEMTKQNGYHRLTLVWYQKAIQIAVTQELGYAEETLASNTWMTEVLSERLSITELAERLFSDGKFDELVAAIKRGDL